ncbi:MAG TPA: maleylpyruvate isomerase family mycothiol-dependent enzyme [Pseudonocardiaceae bacterium]|nr:maleylpyruvate isomerase family mycothiol-dependent enzyme [Pseudonocardiaceae bacterium]
MIDYLDHLAKESARFVDALRTAPADAPVPTCPEWTADDLLRHLGRVQWWWAAVVRDHLTGADDGKVQPDQPTGRHALLAFFEDASRELSSQLASTDPNTPAWTWSTDQTVGFIRRRQAHEALIHRVDAELIAGTRSPMDAALSADGVDEVLRVMYSAIPEWGTFTADPAKTLRLTATDTGNTWLVTLGRFTGTDPDGKSYDEPDFHPADDGSANAEIRGAAADLDCWLWHRPPVGPITRTGDDDILQQFDATIAPGIN